MALLMTPGEKFYEMIPNIVKVIIRRIFFHSIKHLEMSILFCSGVCYLVVFLL